MIYLDNAATTYKKPDEVYDEIINIMKNYGVNPGRGGYKISSELSMKILKTRINIANFFGSTNYERVIFTKNATESLNIAIKGTLKRDDHVIITDLEHNSVIRPLRKLESEGRISLTIIKSNKGFIKVEDVKNEIRDNTRLVVISHVSNLLGSIQDIKSVGELLKEEDIIFLVDAAQSAGVIDINMKDMGIDILALTGHKHLLGPQGTGILLFNEKTEIDSLLEGGTGSFSDEEQPKLYPDKLESGTLNAPGILALAKSIEFIKNIGLEEIRRKDEELIKYFITSLKDIEGVEIYNENIDETSGVVSINILDFTSTDIEDYLSEKYGIITRSGLHCAPLAHENIGTLDRGVVRFSFSYFTQKEEVTKAIDAIHAIINDNRKGQ